MKRVIITLSTLAYTDPNAKVAAVGMTWYDVDEGRVEFKELKRRSLHLPLKFQEQVGRTEDAETARFWYEHPTAASSFLQTKHPYSTHEAKSRIDGWLESNGLQNARKLIDPIQGPQYASLFGASKKELIGFRCPFTLLDAFMPDWGLTIRELSEELPMTLNHAAHDSCLLALMLSISREHLLTVEAPAMAHMALVTGNAVELVEKMAW